MGYQANYAARHFTEGAKQMALIRQRDAAGISRCACGCGAQVTRAIAQFDHALNWWLSRHSGPKNCAALLPPCHGTKTATVDQPLIAKVKRLAKRHAGVKRKRRHPMPCGRDSRWSKPMRGRPVRRQSLAEKHAATMARRAILTQQAEA